MASVAVESSFPAPGLVEQDPEAIAASAERAIAGALAAAGAAPGDVAALGIANQTETFVVWDRATGVPVHPAIVWQDRRTDDACAALREHEAFVRERTGLELDATFPATKLRWVLDRAEPAELAYGDVASLAPAPPRRRARLRRRQRRPLAAVPARRRRLGRRAARPVRHPARAAAADRRLRPHRGDDRRRAGARRRGRPAGVAVRPALLGARRGEGHARHRRVRARPRGRGAAGDPGRRARLHARGGARGRRSYALEGFVPTAGAAVDWFARLGVAPAAAASSTTLLREAGDDARRLRARAPGPRHPELGRERPRRPARPQPRHHPRRPRPRGRRRRPPPGRRRGRGDRASRSCGSTAGSRARTGSSSGSPTSRACASAAPPAPTRPRSAPRRSPASPRACGRAPRRCPRSRSTSCAEPALAAAERARRRERWASACELGHRWPQ